MAWVTAGYEIKPRSEREVAEAEVQRVEEKGKKIALSRKREQLKNDDNMQFHPFHIKPNKSKCTILSLILKTSREKDIKREHEGE